MGQIEQVLWTHCTTKTSFHGGDGYAVRATSISHADWDGSLRSSLESLLMANKYERPSDAPDHTRRAHANRMPVRFSYFPAENNWSILAHDCYRAEDSTQDRRLGAQFAHCLVTRQRPGWSSVDCLRLWRAPSWLRVDPADPRPTLQSAASFEEWTGRVAPVINEELLYRFLTAPPGGHFADPHFVISHHCRRASAQTRMAILHDLLQGFLGLDRRSNAWLLLVADPDLAALLFFGILRLLPKSLFPAPVSFSTFESSLARRGLTLVATTHYDPLNTRLDPAVATRAGCGFIMDLFAARRSELPESDAAYAAYVLRLLRDQGWQAVDQWLGRCEAMGVKNVKELEELTRDHAAVRRLFRIGAEIPGIPSGSRLERYAAMLVQDRLVNPVTTPSGASTFGDPAALALAPGCPTVLKLLFANNAPAVAYKAAAHLTPYLPVAVLADIVADDGFPSDLRFDALQTYVKREGRLPAEWLSRLAADNQPPQASTHHELLQRLIEEAPTTRLRQIVDATSDQTRSLVLRTMAAAAAKSRHCQDLLWDRLCHDPTLSLSSLGSKLYEPMAGIVARALQGKEFDQDQIRRLATGENINTVAVLMLSLKDDAMVHIAGDLLSENSGAEVVRIVLLPLLPPLPRAKLLLHCLQANRALTVVELSQLIQHFHAAAESGKNRALKLVGIAFLSGLEQSRILALALDPQASTPEMHRLRLLFLLLCAIEHYHEQKRDVPHLKKSFGELFQLLSPDRQLDFATGPLGPRIVPHLPQVHCERLDSDESGRVGTRARTAPAMEGLVNRLVRWQAKNLVDGPIEKERVVALARLKVLRNSPQLVPPASDLAGYWHDFLAGLDDFAPEGRHARRPTNTAIETLARTFAKAVPESCSALQRRDLALRYLRDTKAPERVMDGFIHILAERGLEARIKDIVITPIKYESRDHNSSHKTQTSKQFKFTFPYHLSPTVRVKVCFQCRDSRPDAAQPVIEKKYELKSTASKDKVGSTTVTLAELGVEENKLGFYELKYWVEFSSEYWGDRYYASEKRRLGVRDFPDFGYSPIFQLKLTDGFQTSQEDQLFLEGVLNRWNREAADAMQEMDEKVWTT